MDQSLLHAKTLSLVHLSGMQVILASEAARQDQINRAEGVAWVV